jgi:DNA repair exonuclease SbcCD ATPase subunit
LQIIFKSIRIKRFRSFQNEAAFEFDGAGTGLYFLKGKNETRELGSNGAGKSSILDALMWCLYGKTVQGLRNQDIVPWPTGSNKKATGKTEVEICVEIAGKIRRIQRALNPNLLTVDGTEVGQDYIATLIPIPMGLVPYTIVLGQKQPLFFDLTASEKLKIFSECLNLERWEERSAHVKNLVENLEKEIQSKEIEIVSLERELKTVVDDIDRSKEQSKLWEADRSLKLASAEKDITDLKKKIASVMTERDTADLQRERADTELKALGAILDKLYKEERELGNEISKQEREIKQLGKDNEGLSNKLASVIDEECPTCKQSLKSKKLQEEMKKDIKICINVNTATIQGLAGVLTSLGAHYSKVGDTIELQEKAKEQFEKDSQKAWNILSRLDPQIAAWTASIRLLEKQLMEKEDMNNPHTEQLQVLRKRKSRAETAIEDSQKVVTTKREYCERTRFWIKGFKDIKLLVVEEVLQELEITTNGMLEEFGLVGWSVQYDIERETKSGGISKGMNISILSPDNKNVVKWEVWSGGEAQRLKLIGTAALSSVLLNHVGVSTNLEVYDEPTIGLSKEGIQNLVEFLAQRAKDTKKAVWLIDQHAMEQSNFIQTVLVTKKKSGSSIVIV